MKQVYSQRKWIHARNPAKHIPWSTINMNKTLKNKEENQTRFDYGKKKKAPKGGLVEDKSSSHQETEGTTASSRGALTSAGSTKAMRALAPPSPIR
jgi:hypothetical protein